MRRILLASLLVLFASAAFAGNTVNVGSSGGSSGSSGSLLTYVADRAPVDGANNDQCNTGEQWEDTSSGKVWFCTDGATDTWTTKLDVLTHTIAAPATTTDPWVFQIPYTGTITSVECIVEEAATDVTLDLQECTSGGAGCATFVDDVVCDPNSQAGTVTDGGVDAGDWMKIDVTAVTGSPGTVTLRAYLK